MSVSHLGRLAALLAAGFLLFNDASLSRTERPSARTRGPPECPFHPSANEATHIGPIQPPGLVEEILVQSSLVQDNAASCDSTPTLLQGCC
ncbi:hypothetical protein EYF80_041806 [Liparis tanakae]|uniref:Uncharacterized protein n=1 Tax=Liparis tanakae TaxID=230148 RepID=A0A4Z2G517_9TELE|nr:hypothetical protein EYF80_041806 [Liparis tanakae]